MTSASESVPKALTTVFDEAEAAIKKYERLTLSLPVAAVNQLSYAAKQFLASFLVSVAGTFVGVLGTFCAIWMSPSYSLLWRIAVSVGMLVLFALATWWIYVFAARKMLTPKQREALLGVDEFSFA